MGEREEQLVCHIDRRPRWLDERGNRRGTNEEDRFTLNRCCSATVQAVMVKVYKKGQRRGKGTGNNTKNTGTLKLHG